VQDDEVKRRRPERAIGLDAVARDQREADAEQQIDQRDDRNGSQPSRPAATLPPALA
jgi:hypothetical protein